MSSARTSAKKHSAPSASTAAARLGGYLTVSIGAGVLGGSHADAGIVTIDIGPTGFNIGGPNAGLSTGGYTDVSNFPFSGGGRLQLLNKNVYEYDGDFFTTTGLYGYDSLQFANPGGSGNVTNFAAGTTIDGSSTFSSAFFGSNGLFYFKENSNTPFVSPDFGSGSYVGFRTATGNYGWLEATWSSTLHEFQIYSGAYESVAGVGIKAGDTGAAVPEIDPNSFGSALSLVMGSLAVLEHRRRKRTESEPAAVVA